MLAGGLTLAVCVWAGSLLALTRAAAPAPAQAPSQPRSTPARTVPTPQPGRVDPAPRVDYERDVKSILDENCLECHSQDKRKGGLSLATYGDLLEGGKVARSCVPAAVRAA